MNIPRQQLDEALRRVQQGVMQPDEAARWLMDQSEAADNPLRSTLLEFSNSATTTVAALMHRLGPPPDAIQRDWDEQLARLAVDFQRIHGHGLPQLTAHDILIDDDNLLMLSPQILASAGSANPLTYQPVEPQGGLMKIEPTALAAGHLESTQPTALAAGLSGTTNSDVRPEASAYGSQNQAFPSPQPQGGLMEIEPTALAAGLSESTNSNVRPEASAYGSQNQAFSSPQPQGGLMEIEPTALAAGLTESTNSEIWPEASAYGSQNQAFSSPLPQGASGRRREPNERKKSPSWVAKQRWIVPAAVCSLAVLVAGLAIFLLAADHSGPDVAKDSKPSTARGSSIFSPTATDDIEGDFSFAEQSVSAKAEISPIADTGKTNDSKPPNPNPPTPKPAMATLGLDSFAGGNWVTANELLPAANFDTNNVETETATEVVKAATESQPAQTVLHDAAMPDRDQPEDAAIDSPTKQTSGTTSIELPPLPGRNATDESIQPVLMIDQSVTDLEFLFPVETPLALVKGDRNWIIEDKKDHSPLANLVATESRLQFQWTAGAATRPVAKQLAFGLLNGLLPDGTKRPLYLRPMVTADAWPIDFSTGDAKAAWLIGTAPPPGASSLTVEFQLPEVVIQTWVKSPSHAQGNRHQSIVEFSLDGDPTITIRSQLDIRTGTRITLRMRHAVQLDPSLPWQLISADRIQTALGQITDQLARATAQETELKTIYYKATAAEKRVLSPQSDALQEAILQLQNLSKRLTKYEQLMAQLQHASFLIIRLDVDWPESAPQTTQPIFALVAPEVESAEETSK